MADGGDGWEAQQCLEALRATRELDVNLKGARLRRAGAPQRRGAGVGPAVNAFIVPTAIA